MTNEDKMYSIPSELLDNEGKYTKELKLAFDLALKAGANIAKHCEKVGTKAGLESESVLEINTKQSEIDFATAIDVLNEDIIINGISEMFPSHKIVGEESTGMGKPEPLTHVPTWIIDPIDGTTNFASGLPLTCVSIGLCDGGVPVLGVVYAPMMHEMYIGVKDQGSYRNGERIIVSPTAANKALKDSIVLFEFGYARSNDSIDQMLNGVKRILQNGCRTTRTFGSGVLDLCYVASGRVDVVYTGLSDEGWKPWDYCAGMVVVEEAGGCILSLQNRNSFNESVEFDENGNIVDGSRFDIYSDSMVCAVHAGLVEECRRVVLGLE